MTVPENMELLRQNSVVVRIERPLEALATVGRPMSAQNGVEALFKVRDPLYNKVADHKVFSKSPDECANTIIELIGINN